MNESTYMRDQTTQKKNPNLLQNAIINASLYI